MNLALYVNGIDRIGGAEIATRRLAEAFAQHEHRVWLFGSQSVTEWRKHRLLVEHVSANLSILRLPTWQRSPYSHRRTLICQALWAFPVFLRETEIVQFRGLLPETITLARIARALGKKTLCIPMAGGQFGDVATFSAKVPRSPDVFDHVTAFTDSLKQELVIWGITPNRISIVPNGVDTNIFFPSVSKPSHPGIIFAGQFRPEKRIDLILKAWKIVQQAHPYTHFTLVGGGTRLSKVQALAHQLHVTVNFIPDAVTNEVVEHLRANAIFVLAGVSEGMSNALLEAMATGLAPVVSDTPANRAIISDGENGLCFAAESPESLAEKIILLLTNDELRARLSSAAQNTVAQHFTLSGVAERYLDLYRQLLGEIR